jgi:hypothetical protein
MNNIKFNLAVLAIGLLISVEAYAESKSIRTTKQGLVGIGSYGAMNYITGAIQLPNDIQPNIGYGSYEYDSSLTKASVDLFDSGAKIFMGNSFYVEPGLFYASIETEVLLLDGFNFVKGTGEFSAIGAQAYIGNQWMWDFGGYVDVRWLGLLQSLTTDYSISASVNDQVIDASEESGLEDLDISGMQGFVITLGYGF